MGKDLTRPSSLSIAVSGVCNLHCEYCYLKHNNFNIKLDKEILQALQNNMFYKNIADTCNKLSIDTNSIQLLEFTGSETLMHLTELRANLDALFLEFPNVRQLTFLTNFTVNIQLLAEFIKDFADKRKNKQFCYIYLNVSVDGPNDSILQQHGHNNLTDYYKNKFQLFCNDLNKTIKYCKDFNGRVVINFCPTVCKEDFLTYFSDKKNIYTYLDWLYNLYYDCYTYQRKDITSKSHSKIRLEVTPPEIAVPYNFSTKESRDCLTIFNTWLECNYELLNSNSKKYNKKILTYLLHPYHAIGNPYENALNVTHCRGIVILPNNFVCTCPADIFDNAKKIDEENLNELVWANPHLYNEQNADVVLNSSIISNLTSGLISEMALSGQIPFNYFADNSMHKFALNSFLKNACARDNLKMTNIAYLKYTGIVRYYINCFLPQLYQFETNNASTFYRICDNNNWKLLHFDLASGKAKKIYNPILEQNINNIINLYEYSITKNNSFFNSSVNVKKDAVKQLLEYYKVCLQDNQICATTLNLSLLFVFELIFKADADIQQQIVELKNILATKYLQQEKIMLQIGKYFNYYNNIFLPSYLDYTSATNIAKEFDTNVVYIPSAHARHSTQLKAENYKDIFSLDLFN